MANVSKLIMMRHGQSEWNRQNLFTGWVDIPLSRQGIEESIAGGKKISNIYDYTYALGDFSPGDVIDIVVMRNGEKETFKVELGAR